MEPIATPYVPQLGDRVVYILRGHREYLNRAWGGLEAVPGVDNEDDDATKTCYNFKTVCVTREKSIIELVIKAFTTNLANLISGLKMQYSSSCGGLGLLTFA